MEVLRYGCRIPFLCDPPLSKVPISMPSYHPSSTKGVALWEVTRALVAMSAVELAPLPSPGCSSCGRPQGIGDLLSISRSSICSWMSHTSAWRPSSRSFFLFVRMTGCPPSTSRKPTYRFLSIRTLGASFGLWLRARFTSSLPCALAFPRLLRSSPGPWLLFLPFSILGVSA